MKEVLIDGKQFKTLRGFFDIIGPQLVENNHWGKNWNALNDILIGGFVLTDYMESFKITWINSTVSADHLKDFNHIVELIKSHPHITLVLE